MNRVIISPKALEDIEEIKKYISNDLQNITAAKNMVKKIVNRIHSLAKNPMLGAEISSKIGVETNYRYLICNKYLIFYFVQGNVVKVTRVLYSGRDYVKIFME